MTDTTSPPIVFELHEQDGGEVPDWELRLLGHQLEGTHSLDYTTFTPDTITTQCALTYIILHKGAMPSWDTDEQGRRLFTSFYKSGQVHWVAGICRLYFPNPSDTTTAEIMISLLPDARKKEFGRIAVQKLLEYAFDALRVHRVAAPIVCPIRPDHSAAEKKRILFETKRLCWVFERYGFQFEGVSRGAVKDPRIPCTEQPVWHDVHRMSVLDLDYFSREMSGLFTKGTSLEVSKQRQLAHSSPWEAMVRRHEEEIKQMGMWTENPALVVASDSPKVNVIKDEGDDGDEYYDDGGSDGWEGPDDFDD